MAENTLLLMSVLLLALLGLFQLAYTLPQDCSPPPPSKHVQVAILPANHSTRGVGSSNRDFLYLGGLFNVRDESKVGDGCGRVRTRGLQHVEAFMWAVSTFQSRAETQGALPGIDVGAVVFDSCSRTSRLVAQVVGFENCYLGVGGLAGSGTSTVRPANVLAYVGAERADDAIEAGQVFGQIRKTLISHAAAEVGVEDARRLQFLLRTVPSEAAQMRALAAMLISRNWTYVQVVHANDARGRAALSVLRQVTSQGSSRRSSSGGNGKNKAPCVISAISVNPGNYTSDNMDAVVDQLRQNPKADIVVVLAEAEVINAMLHAVRRRYARGEFGWVGGDDWGARVAAVDGVEREAEGAVTMALNATSREAVKNFQTYFEGLKPGTSKYNPWFNEFWQHRFRCHLPGELQDEYPVPCDVSRQDLRDEPLDTYVPYVIQAVDAALLGVENARVTSCPYRDQLCPTFTNTNTRWDKIYNSILHVATDGVTFDSDTGDNQFVDENIYNFRARNPLRGTDHGYEKIGSYSTSATFKDPVYTYDSRGARRDARRPTCSSSPCVECGEMPSSKPSLMASTTSTRSSLVVDGGNRSATVGGGEKQGRQVALREGTWVIALIILAGLGVLLTLIFEIYLMSKMIGTPFVKHWRTMWLGQLLLLAILLSYLTLFAFAPTPTIATCGIIRFGVGGSYAMIFSVLLVKLMIIMSSKNVGYLKGVYQVLMFVFAWGVQLVLDAEWLILRPPDVKYNSVTETWMCGQGFEPHVITLVYVMFLLLITTLLAVRTHGIVTNHREGIFIGLTCGSSMAIWFAWVLLGFLTSNPSFQDPAIAFGLFLTATVTLFIMYMPKVRQLNSMGVEGIYAEDDVPDYAASLVAPSVAAPGSVAAGSVIYGPPSYKSKSGSMVYVNGGVYSEPPVPKVAHLHYEGDRHALHLRHPGTPGGGTPSIRSAPVGGSGPIYSLPRRGDGAPDSLYATTRVLRMTGELSGKPRTLSESGYEQNNGGGEFGTMRSNRSGPASSLPGTLKKPKSLQDLGSL